MRAQRCVGLCPRVKNTRSWGNSSLKKGKVEGGVWRHHDPLPEPRVECKLGQGPEGHMTHGCLFLPSPTSP